MKEHAFSATNVSDSLNWKQYAGLVVRPHRRNQRGLRANRSLEFGEIEVAILIYAQKRDSAPAFFEILAGTQHGAVFDRACYDLFPEWCKLEREMNHRIVGFCAAAGENNFRRLASEQRCQAFPCQIDSFSRLGGKRVAAGRIAIALRQKRQHFLDHGRIQRRGCVVIQINQFFADYHMLALLLLLLMFVLATPASVHDGRRQEFEVTDRELAAFFDENDLEIEIGIKIFLLLQLFHANALLLRSLFKFLL
jgi:hypothetical protein